MSAHTLPAALLLDPAHNSALLRLADYHALMTATRGTVELRRHKWRIQTAAFNSDYVRVRLERE